MNLIQRARLAYKAFKGSNIPEAAGVWYPGQPVYNQSTASLLDAVTEMVATCIDLYIIACAATPMRLYAKTSGKNKRLNFRSKKVKSIAKERLAKVEKRWVEGADDIEEILDHPILTLMDEVNVNDNWVDLVCYVVGQRLSAGNSFIFKKFEGGIPVALYATSPEYWSIIPGKDQTIAKYKYQKGAEITEYDPSEIIHHKIPSLRAELMGRSPLQSIVDTVNSDYEMRKFNAAVFRNSANPSGIFTTDQELTREAYDEARERLVQAYGGSNKAGKVLLGDHDISFQAIQTSLKDLSYIQGIGLTRQSILARYHVPEAMVFLNSANLASSKEAIDMFARYAVDPTLRATDAVWNYSLVRDFDAQNLKLISDSPIPKDAMAEREDIKVWAMYGIKQINEIREGLGFDPYKDVPEGWAGTFPGLQAASNPFNGFGEEPREEPDEDENQDDDDENEDNEDIPEKRIKADRKVIRAEHWKKFDAAVTEHEKKIAAKSRELLGAMWDEMLDQMPKKGVLDDLTGWLFDKKKWSKRFGKELYPLVRQTFLDGAEVLDISFDVNSPRAERILREAENRIKTLPADRWSYIKESLEQGIRDGEALFDLRNRVLAAGESDDKYGAERIARTEAGSAYNGGHYEAIMQDEDSIGSEWVATMDDRTRESHADVDGEKRAKGQRFSNGLLYPGESGAPVAESQLQMHDYVFI